MVRRKAPTKDESALLPPFAALPESAILIPATDEEFAAARAELLQAKVLGFDTESKPLFQVGAIDTGPHLVQFSTTQKAWLLQMRHPQSMVLAREVLGNRQIVKAGFGLDNDKHQLQGRLNVELQNVIDLDRVFKRHGYGASTGVRAAIALVRGESFRKSKKITTSNWAIEHLSDSQRRYAANDAFAAAMVQAGLQSWEAQQPAIEPHQARREPRPESGSERSTEQRH